MLKYRAASQAAYEGSIPFARSNTRLSERAFSRIACRGDACVAPTKTPQASGAGQLAKRACAGSSRSTRVLRWGGRCRKRFVLNGDAMSIDHLPALPAREQQDADRHHRTYQTDGENCARAISVAPVEAEQLNENCNPVANCMLPGIADVTDAPIPGEIGKS